MSIVALSTALDHLRVDAGIEDDLIQMYLDAAETAIERYLGRTIYADEAAIPDDDTTGIAITPAITAAILIHAATLYRYRETVTTLPGTEIRTPDTVRHLLDSYRLGHGV